MTYRLSFLLLVGATPRLAPSTAPNSLVVPGRSLGNITLGADAASLAALGPAATSDDAMQKAWGTWYDQPTPSKIRTELDIYTAPQNNDVGHHTVQVVRTTFTWLHLANGLRVGATLRAIRATYGPLPLATTYRWPAVCAISTTMCAAALLSKPMAPAALATARH